jgi:hypothetical protein
MAAPKKKPWKTGASSRHITNLLLSFYIYENALMSERLLEYYLQVPRLMKLEKNHRQGKTFNSLTWKGN